VVRGLVSDRVEIQRITKKGVSTSENNDTSLEPYDAVYLHFASWPGNKAPLEIDYDRDRSGKIDSEAQALTVSHSRPKTIQEYGGCRAMGRNGRILSRRFLWNPRLKIFCCSFQSI
jgi:hypothetical protein